MPSLVAASALAIAALTMVAALAARASHRQPVPVLVRVRRGRR